jgi:hypothetical protein
MRRLRSLPWYVSASGVVAVTLALAAAANLAVGPYFQRSHLDEANPLASAPATGAMAAAPTPGASVVPASMQEMAPAPAMSPSDLLASGEFVDGAPGHFGRGRALLLRAEDGRQFVRFEDFSVTNGPDLFVVLMPPGTDDYGAGLNLGRLRATDGNINHDVPEGADLSMFARVAIWCRAADVLFAHAPLEAP